jgi:hypothetical protein
MQQVKQEILRQQEEQPVREDVRDGDPVMTVTELQNHQVESTEEQIDTAIEQHQVYIGQRILERIGRLAMAVIAEKEFQSDDDDIDWRAYKKQYLFT